MQLSQLERYTPLAAQVWVCREAFHGMVETEFREFLHFLFHGTDFRLFSLPRRVQSGIPRVTSNLFHGTEFWIVFSSVDGSELNSESFLFRRTAGIPSEIHICSSYSVFRGIIFLSEIPNPSSEYPWYPSESCRLFSEWLLLLYPMKLSNSF